MIIMAEKIKHLLRTSIIKGNVHLDIDLSRYDKRFADAQSALDSRIMTDMMPFMPMDTGQFIDITRAQSAAMAGSGKVVAAAPPMGRMLYMGKKMVDSATGKGPRKIPTGPGEFVWRYRSGAKLVATDIPLKFNTAAHPQVTDHWFDATKEKHLDEWVELAQSKVTEGK